MMPISFDHFESTGLEMPKFDMASKLESLNKAFKTSLKPENNAFGPKEITFNNGLSVHEFRNERGQVRKDFYLDEKIYLSKEKIDGNSWVKTKYDDNGTAYIKDVSNMSRTDMLVECNPGLIPNVTIQKGNIISVTDSLCRPIKAKITDLVLKETERDSLNIDKSSAYRMNDQRGHLIPDRFFGPSSLENIVPQLDKVNQGAIKRIENEVAELKRNGGKIDYEVKVNYADKGNRPSSFEIKVYKDGEPYQLKCGPSKIYNEIQDSVTMKHKFTTTAKEHFTKFRTSEMHETGKKQGIEAATITCAMSTVDNVSQFINGEISAEEAVSNIGKDTATAGAIGYGTGFISTAIARNMSASSHQLIQSLGKSGVPAAAISFGIESYDSVSDFAQGKIDAKELAYDLGENGAGVAGSMAGAAMAGAAVGSVVPGAGTVVGFGAGMVGGMVGYAITTEAYATAVEAGSDAAGALAEKAQNIGKTTIEQAKTMGPDAVANVKSAMNEFASNVKVPFRV